MNREKVFKVVFVGLLFIYISFYFAGVAGYYEYKNYKKTVLTEEQIEKFEKDVKEGKEVNVEDYVVEDKKVVNNKISNLGKRISFGVSGIISKSLAKGFKSLSKFITD
jgi:hypothetical protein